MQYLFSLSDLLHARWQSLGPSISLQKTQFWSFLWLSNIPLYTCTSSLLKSFIPEASEPLVELPANSSSNVSLGVNTGLPRTPRIPYPSILQCLSTTYFPFLISWSRFIFEPISHHLCLFVSYLLALRSHKVLINGYLLPLHPTTIALPSWVNTQFGNFSSHWCISCKYMLRNWTYRMGIRVTLCVSPDPLNTPPTIRMRLAHFWAFLVAQIVKNLSVMQETWVQSVDREDPLEKRMTTHSNILA